VKLMAIGDPQIRGGLTNYVLPKRYQLDIWGNDQFIGQIYRSMLKLHPTHAAVLGDLFSSQLIDDIEFQKRLLRYKTRLFPENLWPPHGFFNVTGNHDIGYNAEISRDALRRYEVAFGKADFITRYDNYSITVFNSLVLDEPGLDDSIRQETLDFLEHVSHDVKSSPAIVLTHIPLFKPEGYCADPPTFIVEEGSGALLKQTVLTTQSTELVLDTFFDRNNPSGVILNGHDHFGCDNYHYYNGQSWTVATYSEELARSTPGVREVTVKSIMGDFGGNVGLLSGIPTQSGQMEFKYSDCSHGPIQIWWTAYVSVCVFAIVLPLYFLFR
ncbi:hypothetical protein CANCADRAFT_15227, partial [Tortispora caseinolytica NRRL Y-17796]